MIGRMHALHEQLQNPLTKERNARNRAQLTKLFQDLSSCPDNHFLALCRYMRNCPEKFFDETVYQYLFDWLKGRDATDRHGLRAYLAGNDTEINQALLFLREINSEPWHDESLGMGDEYDLIRFIDRQVHPTYLRLVEATLVPLARVVAHFSRLDAGKGTDGLDVWAVVQELSGGAADCLVRPYRHIVRNGIAHGGITYLQNEIRYRDKKGKEDTFDASVVVRLCDDLLDTCNGLASAMKVFLIISRERGYVLPRELLLEELQEETQTPWWTIEGCVQSEIGKRDQLLVYARPNSRDRAKIQWSTIQSGILAEFFAPGYDRYFFSLRSPKAWPGWAAFDGKKLQELRMAGVDDISQYGGIVENDLIFFVPKPALPRILGKLDTLAESFRINMPVAMQQVRENLGIPRIVCRSGTVHRNGWGGVLNAEVVVEGLDDEMAVGVIRKQRRRILRSAIKRARKANRLNGAAYLPLGYACVAVFRRDYRRRRLAGFGLGNDLVCTVRLQRMRRIRSPDIMGSTVETMGKWRIAWNKAWLEASGQQLG